MASNNNNNKNSLALIALGKIRTDGDTQSRANSTLDQGVIDDYAEDLQRGCTFPPIVVYHDKLTGDYWLASGFHRLAAYRLAGRSAIEAEVVPGTREAARLFAAGSNASHGLRRSRQDRRRSVLMCLEDAEARHWSANKIARHCGVSDSFARAMKLAFDPTEGGTEFERPMGLFGPDELAKIPSPAQQQQQQQQQEPGKTPATVKAGTQTMRDSPDEPDDRDEEEDGSLRSSPEEPESTGDDREKNFERARRTWRKLMRFADLLGFSSLTELTQELQRREDAAREAEVQKEVLAREMERVSKLSQEEKEQELASLREKLGIPKLRDHIP